MLLDKFTIDMLPLTRQNILVEGEDYFANITFKLTRFFTCFHGRLYADKFLEFLEIVCNPSIRPVQVFSFLQLHEFHFRLTTLQIVYEHCVSINRATNLKRICNVEIRNFAKICRTNRVYLILIINFTFFHITLAEKKSHQRIRSNTRHRKRKRKKIPIPSLFRLSKKSLESK